MRSDSWKNRMIAPLLSAALVLAAFPAVSFATTQEQLDEANSEVSALEEEQSALESQIASYQSSLSSLAAELDEIVTQIDEKQAEIDAAQEQIAALEISIDEKQELICSRAQYVYESSGTSALQILLSSTSFADFLNKAQFLNDLNTYDSDLMAEYNEACAELTALKDGLETELAQLESLRTASEEKQTSLYALIEETNAQLKDTESELASASSLVSELEEEIEAASLAAQLAQAQTVQAEISETASSSGSSSADTASSEESTSGSSSSDSSSSDSSSFSSTSSGSSSSSSSSSDSSSSSSGAISSSYTNYSGRTYSATEEETILLAAIIYCEAGGESYAGQLAVGSVIMNRVYSSSFPNTISGVVYQSGQFSPASSGRLDTVIANGSYSTSCMNAALEVLGGNLTVNYLFFCSASSWTGSDGYQIGNHVFF